MADILVTGGAGYIGSILVPLLLQQGHRVTVVDNLRYRQHSLVNCIGSSAFRFIKADATNPEVIATLMKSAEWIIPLAALVGAPICAQDPFSSDQINAKGIDLIIANLRPHQKILYPNTNSGYGIGEEGVACTEESPLKPVSLYGRQKVEAERKLLQTGQAVSFRLATVFGVSPRMRLDLLVNDFTYRAWKDRFIVLFEEHFKRNYIHIQDVARAFLFGLDNFSKMRGEAYNVGLSSANLSKRELCEMIKKFIPDLSIHSAEIGEDPDKRNYTISHEKLEKLGWHPTKSVEDGIQELLQAFPLLYHPSHANA